MTLLDILSPTLAEFGAALITVVSFILGLILGKKKPKSND